MFLTLDDALEALETQLHAVQETAAAGSCEVDEQLFARMVALCECSKEVHLLAIGERRPDSEGVRRTRELIEQYMHLARTLKPRCTVPNHLLRLEEFIEHSQTRLDSLEEAANERRKYRQALACAAGF